MNLVTLLVALVVLGFVVAVIWGIIAAVRKK
jgi:hypothetical protein